MPLANGPMYLSNSKKYEPQRTNHFEVQIMDLPGGASAAKELTLAVSEFSLPNVSTQPTEIGHGNSKVKFASQVEFGGADNLVVNDYIGADIEGIVNAWQKQVYDPETDTIGFAEIYKKTAEVTEFAPDGTLPRTWRLEGCWPTGVAYGDSLTHDGSEVKKVTITLAYDKGYRI